MPPRASTAQQLSDDAFADQRHADRQARTLRLVRAQTTDAPLAPLETRPSPLIDAVLQYLDTLP